ncbi:hypothetical protein BN946_scf184569.g54 [Trametes cinnabarina]|uniref:Cytochrome P450 n=1 Tax=Pycnoporus cinnabarinus TaxID=5643 RepID=A0A060S8E2_PYCCI|nr:hypothetical protein BN946_scf184569.g54 [Trametes cinnabarina]
MSIDALFFADSPTAPRQAPFLYVFDPLALQHILKDTETFDEMPWYLESNRLMFGPGVLAVSAISSRLQDDAADIDMMNWMSRTALELIGQSGIGHSFDPLTEDVADAYAEAVKSFTATATCAEMMLLRQMTAIAPYMGPLWLRRWLIERLPLPVLQRLIQIVDALHFGSLKLLREKKIALRNEKNDGQDIISILLRANSAASEEDRLPDDELLGQMSSIIFAAMDTTSNALSRVLHLLAGRPELQEKLRHEVMEAKAHGEQLDYDQLHALPFLDAVCRETLRL